jgi:MFS family permease
MKEFRPLLKNRNFLYLWSSQVLSQLAINIMNFLLLIKLFAATESAIATSFLWVAYSLPVVFVGPFASASVDMIERRKILTITNLLQSITIFVYAILNRTQVFLVYGVAMVYSLLNQFYVPAESASLPSLVKKQVLAQANGLFFLTQQASLVLGFGVAGILNQFLGFERSLFLCAGFLFLAFVSVLFLPRIEVEESIPRNFEEMIFKFFGRIKEGYDYIRINRGILIPFVLLMSLQIALAIIMVNIPLIANDILHINVNSAGVLIIAPAGLGAGMGALLVPLLLKRNLRKKQVIENSLALMTLCFILLIFLLPELSGVLQILFALVIVVLMGAGFVACVIPAQTFLQEQTPGGLRGRVFGNFWFLVTIATIFPVVFSGTISELFGIKLLLLMLASLTLAGFVYSKKKGDGLLAS